MANAWANSADGVLNFSTTLSGGRRYIGTADSTSSNPRDYSWELINHSLVKASVTYGNAKLKAQDFWERGFTGKGIKIGIVDDGIGIHDALPIAGGLACGPLTTYIQGHYHPTHVAGIALARNLENGQPCGIAPEAELYSIRMYYNTFVDRMNSIIEAIDYAIENDIDILNMSIHISEYNHGTGSAAGAPKHMRLKFREAFIRAYSNGVIIVVSAGNNNSGDGKDNIEMMELLPKMPNVIAVGNTTIINTRFQTSGVGRWVSVAAPGTNILSTYPDNEYSILTGTSMAAAMVSGMFALYKDFFADLTAQEIIEKLLDNCIHLDTVSNLAQGYGMPQPPDELYNVQVGEYSEQLYIFTNFQYKAIERAYFRENNEWKEMEAQGYGE